ncbi:AAA family ATPase [Pseudoxanthomonas sp. PXM01]|nr:AAA family ATPase [Pseudoxanthomonas sp. PXM01]
MINFQVFGIQERPSNNTINTVRLSANNWDDYSFKTLFNSSIIESSGVLTDLGSVKIGFVGQPTGWTLQNIPRNFFELPDGWFSLGQSPDYYQAIMSLSEPDRLNYLRSMRDVVFNPHILETIENEQVFNSSLTRNISTPLIRGQFTRIVQGFASLTEFNFLYARPQSERKSGVNLSFKVEVGSKPSTNIHVLIGRNGVGKTTILNEMISAAIEPSSPDGPGRFYENNGIFGVSELPPDYFSGAVSVSFSAFDPFTPPPDRSDIGHGPSYCYIGMKQMRAGVASPAEMPPKTSRQLVNDLVLSTKACLSQSERRSRWERAIRRLESDSNFADMELGRIASNWTADDDSNERIVRSFAERMSSGHAVVLLTISRLIEKVEEKTLVLMDEPESHLHPPLLSAFTRALSELLHDRNGVAIIATHSPVILQEVPRSCVWKLDRRRTSGRSDRPETETFGENVGTLTKEVFGLEVQKSGFHAVLTDEVAQGKTFDQIMTEYKNQLGTEATAVLLALIRNRDNGGFQ